MARMNYGARYRSAGAALPLDELPPARTKATKNKSKKPSQKVASGSSAATSATKPSTATVEDIRSLLREHPGKLFQNQCVRVLRGIEMPLYRADRLYGRLGHLSRKQLTAALRYLIDNGEIVRDKTGALKLRESRSAPARPAARAVKKRRAEPLGPAPPPRRISAADLPSIHDTDSHWGLPGRKLTDPKPASPQRKARAPARFPCPRCERRLASPEGVRSHISSKHS